MRTTLRQWGLRGNAATVVERLPGTPSEGADDPPVVVVLREGVFQASVVDRWALVAWIRSGYRVEEEKHLLGEGEGTVH